MTFAPLNRTQFEAKCKLATANGIAITGDSGVAKVHTPLGEIDAQYAYDEAQQTLTITIQHKPWLIPESEIESKLNQYFTL